MKLNKTIETGGNNVNTIGDLRTTDITKNILLA